MASLCFHLLEQPEVEAAIRVGDVYALMVEWFHSQGQMDQAYNLIEKMQTRSIILSPCASRSHSSSDLGEDHLGRRALFYT